MTKPIEVINVVRGRGKDTYIIRTLMDGFTANELIDFCDPHNWGGTVNYLGQSRYVVVVYTD